MKPITTEWIRKADADLATARREYAVDLSTNFDAVCFHCQQAIEKLLKARLQEADIPFPKIHDLVPLLDKVITVEPGWETFGEAFNAVTLYAVETRYPGESCDQDEAKEALEVAEQFRQAIRVWLEQSG